MFTQLPRDILIKITLELDIIGIKRQSKCSRVLADLGKDERLWTLLCDRDLLWKNVFKSKFKNMKHVQDDKIWKNLCNIIIPKASLPNSYRKQHKIQMKQKRLDDKRDFCQKVKELTDRNQRLAGNIPKRVDNIRDIAEYLVANKHILDTEEMELFKRTVEQKFSQFIRDDPFCEFLKEYYTQLFET